MSNFLDKQWIAALPTAVRCAIENVPEEILFW